MPIQPKIKDAKNSPLRFLLSPFLPIFPFHTDKSLESTKEQHLLAFLSAAQAKSTITAEEKRESLNPNVSSVT